MTFVSDTSQSQIKEVVRYLKRVSWDFCGIELLYSDLIDMTIEANKNGQELFDVVTDAKTFANSVKNELNPFALICIGYLIKSLYSNSIPQKSQLTRFR